MSFEKDFPDLKIDGPDDDGVLVLCFDRPKQKNAVTVEMHRQLAEVWPELDRDQRVRSILVRGAGDAFSAGGDFELLEGMIGDEELRLRAMEEARAIVVNMLSCSKPIVSAIKGPAVGAGLAVALLADISIAAESALLLDGHTRIGVAAGDHAVIIWPLLCGLAKAKRYLLLPDSLDGREAERIGLVSMCVADGELEGEAEAVARRLARSSPTAIRWTKRSLNGWLHSALPAFDASLALEFLGFASADAKEGMAALRERRDPDFHGRTGSDEGAGR